MRTTAIYLRTTVLHLENLFVSAFLNFDNYLKVTSVKLYYQIQHNLIPSLISSLLPRLSNTQITRVITNRENPLPRYKNNYGYRSFFYSGTENWNEIPLNLHSSSSLVSFKWLYNNLLMGGQVCGH